MKTFLKKIRVKWHNDVNIGIDGINARIGNVEKLLTPPPSLFMVVEKIVNALQDDVSRGLFFTKLESNTTNNNIPFYKRWVDFIFTGKAEMPDDISRQLGIRNVFHLIKEIDSIKNNGIYCCANMTDGFHLYKLGVLIDFLQGMDIQISGIVDSGDDYHETFFRGIPLIKKQAILVEINIILVFVDDSSPKMRKLVEAVIQSRNNAERMFLFLDFSNTQYFDKVFIPGIDEIFVDAGMANMSTSFDFVRWAKHGYKAIYAFEPLPASFNQSKEKLKENQNWIDIAKFYLYNKGLSDKTCTLKFFEDLVNPAGSTIDPNGNIDVEFTTLDEILDGKKVTFIKMDIEGAELAALHGAEKTIRRWEPKLAICIYHKKEDVIEIPSYILSIVPGYKMWIRQYCTMSIWETVLLCQK